MAISPPPPASEASPVADFLARVALGPRQVHKALTVWPLVHAGDGPPPGPDYAALGQALEDGHVQVDEVDGGGVVPYVRVTNRGGRAILLLFGEELRGALQNRVANASFLVPARSELVVDVSCVEAGRWSRGAGRGGFAASGEVLAQQMRQGMARHVAASRARGERFGADQSEVWDAIDERLGRARARSSTRAYADYLGTRRSELDDVLRAFRPLPGQVGFVAMCGGAVVGLEAIGRPEVFAHHFAGLLRSYAVDALDAGEAGARREAVATAFRPPDGGASARAFDAPEPFLAALARAGVRRSPSLGLGDDLRIDGEGVAGCALVHEGAWIHGTACPEQPAEEPAA